MKIEGLQITSGIDEDRHTILNRGTIPIGDNSYLAHNSSLVSYLASR